jgi:hypothetical protein
MSSESGEMQPCNIEGDLLEIKPLLIRWEYYVMPLQISPFHRYDDIRVRLNMAGLDGWELVQILQTPDGLTACMKRDRNLWIQGE